MSEVVEESERKVAAGVRRCAKERGVEVVKLKYVVGRGWPDDTLLAPGGRVAFLETKRTKGGKFERGQEAVHFILRKLGFRVGVPRTVHAVEEFFTEWLD